MKRLQRRVNYNIDTISRKGVARRSHRSRVSVNLSIACFVCPAMKQRLIQLDVVTIKHQKIVTDSIVCRWFPHNQDGSEAWCHLTRLATHRPWPVRNLFSVDHRCRDGLKPGGQTVGSVMSDWLTTVVLNHASTHSEGLPEHRRSTADHFVNTADDRRSLQIIEP